MRRDEPDAGYIRLRLNGNVPEGVTEINAHSGILGKLGKLGVIKQLGDYLIGNRAVYRACRVGQNALFLKGHIALLAGDHIAAIGDIAGV